MLLRQELPGDADPIRAVHNDAFAAQDDPDGPAEPGLVDALRADAGWIPELSLVALGGTGAPGGSGRIVGHVVATRGYVGEHPALGLGPIGVLGEVQRTGVGAALMHAVLAAADARGEPLVALLGHPGYYRRFGFAPARRCGVHPPDPGWTEHFQVRALTAHQPEITGTFRYAAPFGEL